MAKSPAAKKDTAPRRAPSRSRTKSAPEPPPRETRGAGGSDRGPTRDDIERRAYEIYRSRGHAHGSDVEDWLQAERELNAEPRKPS